MSLKSSYSKVKPSIVAIARRVLAPGSAFPEIIGTGFFITEDGLVMTNRHVIERVMELQSKPAENLSDLVTVLYFELAETGMRMVTLPVDAVSIPTLERKPGDISYGEDVLDVGLISVPGIRECPPVTISGTELEDGQEIAVAGFPMGTTALTAPGWLHQISATLQKGIVSSALPFSCATPHGYLINIMSQGGLSGSPVFLPETGEVVGILYAGLFDREQEINPKSGYVHIYKQQTALSVMVPGWYLKKVVEAVRLNQSLRPATTRVPLKDHMAQLSQTRILPNQPFPVTTNPEHPLKA